jgi:HEAT repeat protein
MFEKFKIGSILARYPKAEKGERKESLDKLDSYGEMVIPMAADELRYNRLLYADAAEIFARMYKKDRLPTYIRGLGDQKENVRQLYKDTIAKSARMSATSALIELLGSPDHVARKAAAELLVEFDDPSIASKVIPFVRHENRDVKKTALDVLTSVKSDRAAEAIYPLLDDNDSWVRRKAIEAICKLKDKSTLPKLREVAAREKDMGAIKAIIDAMGEIGESRDAEMLLTFVKSEDMVLRQISTTAVMNIADASLVPKVVELLMVDSVNLRRAAVDILNGLKDPKTAGALVKALKDGDWWVREIATDALSSLGGEKISSMIMGLLTDGDEYVRRSAVEFFCRVKDEAAFELLIGLLGDKDWWVREKAITALGLIGDPKAIPYLEKLTGDSEVKWAIPSALGKMGTKAALKPLSALMRDSQRQIRLAALEAVVSIEEPESLGLIKSAALDDDTGVMSAALKILREKTGRVWLKEDVVEEIGAASRSATRRAPVVNAVNVKQGDVFTEAILVADLCNSTDLGDAYGDNFVFTIMNEFAEIIMIAARDEGVRFTKSTGDGYLMMFDSVENALQAAMVTLKKVAERNAATEKKRRIGLRFAVNQGETRVDTNNDRVGVAVNMTFRAEGVKKEAMVPGPGAPDASDSFPLENRILLTEAAYNEIKKNPEYKSRFMGFFELKGITGLHRIYQCLTN